MSLGRGVNRTVVVVPAENNNVACEYDGGDCCKSTCRSKHFDCVLAGVCREECIDPAAAAYDDSCNHACQWGWVGDGRCDEANNKACLWICVQHHAREARGRAEREGAW